MISTLRLTTRMHARELVELAAAVCASGRALVELNQPISAAGLGLYWSASKCRLDRWGRALKPLARLGEKRREGKGAGDDQSAPDSGDASQVAGLVCLLEEIIVSDVLTRVWTAISVAHDQRRATQDASPITQNILAGHIDAQHRALGLLLGEGVLGADCSLAIDRLRRRSEYWTCLLIGQLGLGRDACDLAPQPHLARELARDVRQRGCDPTLGSAWPLVLAGLRSAMGAQTASNSPNADLNARIAEGVLACLPAELFDSRGVVYDLWVARIRQSTGDVSGLISSFFAEPGGAADADRCGNKRFG